MIRENRLPRKALRLWQTRCGLSAAFPVTVLFLCLPVSLWFWVPLLLILAFNIGLIFFYLPRFAAAFRFSVDTRAVTVRRGVWIRLTTVLPRTRQLYTAEISTPLSRRFGLSCCVFKTVRGWLFLPGLPPETVAAIRKEAGL